MKQEFRDDLLGKNPSRKATQAQSETQNTTVRKRLKDLGDSL